MKKKKININKNIKDVIKKLQINKRNIFNKNYNITEKKRLKSENQKKVENDKINNERREKMLLWLKNKDELIKNKKASERKIKKQKKIEEEKNNKEKKEQNKQIFIQWLRNKINKLNEEIIQIKKMID